MRNLILPVLFLFPFFILGSEPQKIVHRANVASPVKLGWIQASSTDGKFSADLPFPYTDTTIHDENQHFHGYSLISFKENESYFIVITKGIYKDKLSAGQSLDKFLANARKMGVKPVQIMVNGKVGYETQFSKNGSAHVDLCIPMDSAIIMVQMESAPSMIATNFEKYTHVRKSLILSSL